jgi:hypothetical protein
MVGDVMFDVMFRVCLWMMFVLSKDGITGKEYRR